MTRILRAFDGLEPEPRGRVARWAIERLEEICAQTAAHERVG